MKFKLLAMTAVVAAIFLPKISRAESISIFNSAVTINQDSSINVLETIVYDFGETPHHGIYRDIPYHYQNQSGNYNLGIAVKSVTDENNNPYIYTVSKTSGNVEIKIGDPAYTIIGTHTYILNYTVKGAINYFSDHDELYWNTTGNDWQVPMAGIQQVVNLPQAVAMNDLKATCYAGVVGATTPCAGFNANTQGTQTYFTQNNLAPGQELTIVVGFPKGLVHQPTLWEKILQAVKDNIILLLPIVVFIGMWLLRRKYGSDAGKTSTIVAQYEAPADLTPTESGALLDESANNKDISAEIINLAVKGYLKITKLQSKVLLFNVTDYQLDLLKPADDELSAFEKQVVQSLFGGLSIVKLSDLKNRFYRDIPTIQKLVLGTLTEKEYLKKNPSNTKGLFTFLGALVIFAGFFLGKFGGYYILSMLVSGIIILTFSRLMSFRTAKGVEAKQYILGLKLYLSVAEKDRLKFTDAPDKTPERFEKLLPYAMVLGVEQDWAKQFEGIYNVPPRWYSDPMGGPFNSLVFAHSLHEFNNSAGTTMTSSPRGGAGSGSSGFGGGGFSGGGFGGGGGGSW